MIEVTHILGNDTIKLRLAWMFKDQIIEVFPGVLIENSSITHRTLLLKVDFFMVNVVHFVIATQPNLIFSNLI